MKALIAAHGGKNSGSISGKTTYLLAGEKAGPEKLKKAESLHVLIISEQEFYSLIEQSNNNNSSSEEIDGRDMPPPARGRVPFREGVSVINSSDEPTLF
jgi:BRCT domain type II-containing protein